MLSALPFARRQHVQMGLQTPCQSSPWMRQSLTSRLSACGKEQTAALNYFWYCVVMNIVIIIICFSMQWLFWLESASILFWAVNKVHLLWAAAAWTKGNRALLPGSLSLSIYIYIEPGNMDCRNWGLSPRKDSVMFCPRVGARDQGIRKPVFGIRVCYVQFAITPGTRRYVLRSQ